MSDPDLDGVFDFEADLDFERVGDLECDLDEDLVLDPVREDAFDSADPDRERDFRGERDFDREGDFDLDLDFDFVGDRDFERDRDFPRDSALEALDDACDDTLETLSLSESSEKNK